MANKKVRIFRTFDKKSANVKSKAHFCFFCSTFIGQRPAPIFAPNQVSLTTSSIEAQRVNQAVFNYDFIYLVIAIAATLLFIFETLYRVQQIYTSTTNGRSIKRKRRKKRHLELCHQVLGLLSKCQESHLYK